MFFSPSLNRNLLDNERKEQRKFLYSNLYTALQDSELSLVWPINQTIDPKNTKMQGYCHGYGEVWTKYLLENKGWEEPLFEKAAWFNLMGDEDYTLSSMPLSHTIKATQALMPSGIAYRARGEAVTGSNVQQLIEEILTSSLGTLYPEWPKGELHMFVVSLGSKRDPSDCLSLLRGITERSSAEKWHELRICVDPKGCLHLFDPNGFWLRSNPNPTINHLKRDLCAIFQILQYPEKYSVASVFKVFEKSINFGIPHRERSRIVG